MIHRLVAGVLVISLLLFFPSLIPTTQGQNVPITSSGLNTVVTQNTNTFTVAGRDTLPVEPGGWLTSPLLAAVSPDAGSTVMDDAVPSLSEGTTILSLRRLPSLWTIAQLREDWLSGCGSS